jgi:hypothetical protein
VTFCGTCTRALTFSEFLDKAAVIMASLKEGKEREGGGPGPTLRYKGHGAIDPCKASSSSHEAIGPGPGPRLRYNIVGLFCLYSRSLLT